MQEWKRRELKKKELEEVKGRITLSIKSAKRGQRRSADENISEKERFMAGYWQGRLDVLGENLRDVMEELEEYSDLDD